MAKSSTERTRAYRQLRKAGEIREVALNIWLTAALAHRLEEIACSAKLSKRKVIERLLEAAKPQ